MPTAKTTSDQEQEKDMAFPVQRKKYTEEEDIKLVKGILKVKIIVFLNSR